MLSNPEGRPRITPGGFFYLFRFRARLEFSASGNPCLKKLSHCADVVDRWERDVRILLVDDSKAIRMENESALHKAGYDVICAEDGDSALKLAREHKPDLILLDMILPKMSGPEVLRHLKQDQVTAGIPVVVVSSLTEKNRQKLIDAGAEDYIEKNSLIPMRGMNLLPKMLETIICRINRKRGVAFSEVPLQK
jgi:CheY-like chemotaxis protein